MYALMISIQIGLILTKSQILHYLIEWSEKNNGLDADMHLLNGDAFALIVAGRYAMSRFAALRI
jgi:hypothetical protein